MAEQKKSSKEKVRAHRERLRKQGLRPVQFWVPDVRAPGFEEEIRRQVRLVAASPGEQDNIDWADSLAFDAD